MQKYADIVKVCRDILNIPNILNVLIQTYKLGDPTLPETNLGPVVSVASADRIRKQVADAGTCCSLSPCVRDHSHSPCWRKALDP